ncbi:hypothetical protein TNCV_3232991 [Trichonephila clavipes]|nr:hypothetical protein TNCV_3232991 [Trichonephila clavipes]
MGFQNKLEDNAQKDHTNSSFYISSYLIRQNRVSNKANTYTGCPRIIGTNLRLVKGEERWEALDHPQGVLPQNWGGTEQNRTVSCMELKAKVNDKRKN